METDTVLIRGKPPDSPSTDSRPPEALVNDGKITFGSWRGIPGSANLIDADPIYPYAIPRFMKRMRLKEWRAIQAGDDDWFIFAVLYDAKFISMASIDLWDRKNKKKYGFRRMFPGSKFMMSQSLEFSETHADAGTDHLSIRVDPEASFIGVHGFSKPCRTAPEDMKLDLRLDFSETSSSPISVCLPIGSGKAMYSTKVILPCEGSLSIDGMKHHFNPAVSLAAFDDHKGYYPYRLHYDWVTGFGVDQSGRRTGFNLTDNQVEDQVQYNENRLWSGTTVYSLPPVKISRPGGRDKPWFIKDAEGVVDLVFHPETRNDISVKLGIAAIDYAGPFGRFEGSIRIPSGETIDTSLLYGMGEDKSMRL